MEIKPTQIGTTGAKDPSQKGTDKGEVATSIKAAAAVVAAGAEASEEVGLMELPQELRELIYAALPIPDLSRVIVNRKTKEDIKAVAPGILETAINNKVEEINLLVRQCNRIFEGTSFPKISEINRPKYTYKPKENVEFIESHEFLISELNGVIDQHTTDSPLPFLTEFNSLNDNRGRIIDLLEKTYQADHIPGNIILALSLCVLPVLAEADMVDYFKIQVIKHMLKTPSKSKLFFAREELRSLENPGAKRMLLADVKGLEEGNFSFVTNR